jgi:ABC-2 type transport system permease protein
MYVINAVFKRNFMSYFSGVLGYLFIVAFVALGSFFAFSEQFFANNLANLDQLNTYFPILLLFFVPAITMAVWSDERKLGTDELLFTLPASDLEILLGKYAAVAGIYTVALFFSLSHVIVLISLGSPDKGLMFATYFGYWIAGCAMLSAGMLASILTSSATVAYVLGTLICAIPVFIDKLAPNSRLFQGLSVGEQFRDFALGMVPLGGVLYFVSLTVLMLYLNLVFISRRHWSGGPHQSPMWAHYLTRAVALAAVLISINSMAVGANRRFDLTEEKLYSLSPTTQKILAGVKSDRPVLVQAFISPEVPRELVSSRSTLIGLLRQFGQQGGSRVRVRIVNTSKFTDTAEEAKRYGIDSLDVQSERGGRIVHDDVFLGVVITSVDEQVVIPFFDKGTPIEYELARSIRTVSESNRKKIGILRTDAQVIGGFDMQSFRQLPEWRVALELKKQYDVKQVGPEELATSNVDVLVAVMPSSLTDPEMRNFIDYFKRGKPTLIIDDPYPVFAAPGLAPHSPKPNPGGMMGMMGGRGPQQPKADDGKATSMSTALGIVWDSGETVWDRYDPHPHISEFFEVAGIPDVVYVAASNGARYAFNPDSPITHGLQEVMSFYPGSFHRLENDKIKFDPLLRASPRSVTYKWDEYVQSAGFMGQSQLIVPPRKDPKFDQTSPVVAARITSSGGADSGLNVVFVADMDMISNTLFFVRDKEWQDLKLDNVTFILNAVDELAGEQSLLALRSRQATHRTLTTVENRTNAFKTQQTEESSKADEDAKAKLADVQKRLDEDVNRIEADKTLDPRTKEQMKIAAAQKRQTELDVAKVNIENEKKRKVKEIKDTTEREVRTIENKTRMLAIAIPPIPALLLGIFFFSLRVQHERQGIVPDRLVGKK